MLKIITVFDACGTVVRDQSLMLQIPDTKPVTLSLEDSEILTYDSLISEHYSFMLFRWWKQKILKDHK
jgi:hypothetical protein